MHTAQPVSHHLIHQPVVLYGRRPAYPSDDAYCFDWPFFRNSFNIAELLAGIIRFIPIMGSTSVTYKDYKKNNAKTGTSKKLYIHNFSSIPNARSVPRGEADAARVIC